MEKPSLGALSLHDQEDLKLRHRQIEQRLVALERHLSLSPAEQLERSRLKKEKLWIKDRLAVLNRTPPIVETAARAAAE